MSYDFDFGLFNMNGFPDEGDEHVSEDLPLLPLRDTVVFPHMMTPLAVGRDRSLNALEAARSRGALSVNLTCNPRRKAANALYARMGFKQRQTNVYRYELL